MVVVSWFAADIAREHLRWQWAHVKSNARHGLRLHPLPVRIMHWINAAAMIIMIMSGWKIYNDDVIFGWLHFPDAITLGTWAQHGLQWHFFGMWIFVLNGLAYLSYGICHRPVPTQAVSRLAARADCRPSATR